MRQLDRSRRYRATLRLMPWAYRLSDAIVAVSQGVSNDIAGPLGPANRSRLSVIANPILRDDWQALSEAALDDDWFLPGSTPVILSVGRLSPEKNFVGLIRAYAGLRLPWTLSDPVVWQATHRVSGLLSLVAGMLLVALALFTGDTAILLPATVAAVTIPIAVGAAVSWRLSRH